MATVELHPDVVSAYHAHVYYTPETRVKAAALRARLRELFPVQLGRWHDVPVGPHSQACTRSCSCRMHSPPSCPG
jgi:aromatic ring-cleaving dioxygenase